VLGKEHEQRPQYSLLQKRTFSMMGNEQEPKVIKTQRVNEHIWAENVDSMFMNSLNDSIEPNLIQKQKS